MQKPGLFGMNGFMVFLTCLSLSARAQQQGYLILLETENKQAFTVRLGDQVFTSSGHDHLVLSNLRDSTYRLNIRFPKKNMEELVFPVKVNQKDLAFQLKENDSVWILFNWQTKETIHSIKEKDSSRILDQGVKRQDGFSRLMAAVVNDSSVMYNTYSGSGFNGDSTVNAQSLKPKAQSPLPVSSETVLSAINRQPSSKDSLLASKKASDSLLAMNKKAKTKDSPSTAYSLPSTVNRPPSTTLPGVKKLREVSLKISRKMVFIDIARDGTADTVTLFVYFENNDTAISKQPLPGPVFTAAKTLKPDSAVANSAVARNKAPVKVPESGCGQLATDADTEFLRSAILKANAEDDKINLAAGAFQMKCFSVSQIRLLAGLFVSDKARYRLMDAAHLHLSDPEHFRELVNMYTDKNFQRKFLSLADKRS